jgi:hypothetical protein
LNITQGKKQTEDPKVIQSRKRQVTYRSRYNLYRNAVHDVLRAKTLTEAKRICQAAADWRPEDEGTAR